MNESSAEMPEDFLDFEAKVEEAWRILHATKLEDIPESTATEAVKSPPEKNFDGLDVDNCKLTVSHDRTAINRNPSTKNKPKPEEEMLHNAPATMDKDVFMKAMEADAEKRYKTRLEHERKAENFKKQGNEAFRKGDYEKAIIHFGKAIEEIKYNALFWTNRALAYLKLGNYKRTIADCDRVIEKIEEGNLRAWLYRASAYYKLNDEAEYQKSIESAKQHNGDKLNFIEKTVEKICEGAL